jgi:hypothetical protein
VLEKFYGKWKGNVEKVYKELDYAKNLSVMPQKPAAQPSPVQAFNLKKAV